MQGRALFLSVMVITLSLSGCFGEEAVTPPVIEEEPSDARVFVSIAMAHPLPWTLSR